MKTIIAGSREIDDYSLVKAICSNCPWMLTTVISGGAKGIDRLGERFANENSIKIERFIPDWNNLGKKAGMLRNKQMLENCDAGYNHLEWRIKRN